MHKNADSEMTLPNSAAFRVSAEQQKQDKLASKELTRHASVIVILVTHNLTSAMISLIHEGAAEFFKKPMHFIENNGALKNNFNEITE